MEFIDIHTHIIPGIDDGSASVDETIAMLKIAYESGTRKMVATPHMFLHLFNNNDFVEVQNRFSQLLSVLEPHQDRFPFLKEMNLYLGAENHASPEFLEALDQGCILTLNGSRYLLVEFPNSLPFRQIETVVQRILLAGFIPVIAHSERYAPIQDDPQRMEALWRQGAMAQVNADSLVGGSGSGAGACAERLLEEGLVEVIASDAHRLGWRPPYLEGVYRKLVQEYQDGEVKRWLWTNAEKMLANEESEGETS